MRNPHRDGVGERNQLPRVLGAGCIGGRDALHGRLPDGEGKSFCSGLQRIHDGINGIGGFGTEINSGLKFIHGVLHGGAAVGILHRLRHIIEGFFLKIVQVLNLGGEIILNGGGEIFESLNKTANSGA